MLSHFSVGIMMTDFDSACQYHRWLASHDTTSPLHFSSLCARHEGDWEEGITMQLHEFILPCIASCTLRCPFPPLSLPCSAGNRRSTDSSDSYHVDGAIYWSIVRKSITSGVTAKKISPDNDTTQYMQISPSSQYPDTGIVRTLVAAAAAAQEEKEDICLI